MTAQAEPPILAAILHAYGIESTLARAIPPGSAPYPGNTSIEVFKDHTWNFGQLLIELAQHFGIKDPNPAQPPLPIASGAEQPPLAADRIVAPVAIDDGTYCGCIIGVRFEQDIVHLTIADPHIGQHVITKETLSQQIGTYKVSLNRQGRRVDEHGNVVEEEYASSLEIPNHSQLFMQHGMADKIDFSKKQWMVLIPH